MSKKEKVFRCAMYLRLSKEDDSIATASNSIVNQEKMIRMYIDDHDDLVFKKKYVDDGVSGSGFDRPGFNKMMRDADAGEIDCIIVKDLSRFGRNHYECDRYMQMVFPQKGIRFIAITDNYDSNNDTSEMDMFMIPIKKIMNDNYCRDKVIAMYMRLSVADDDFEEDESNSIKAQRDLIYQYINEKEEFKDYEIEEFCDDGYSGTNFDRPGVRRMLELTESGIINVIIVKDFSRFGRNSIDVGHYIEEIFPYTGLRFIAINDRYDSNDYVGDTGGFEISIKNLISQIYAQDASKKIRTSFQSKARNGEYIGFQKIYGYVINENKKLIVDREPAEVVKKIFEMRCQGMTYDAIAKYLNDEKILVPRLYFKYKKLRDDGAISEMNMWTRTILHKMINNEQYTGKLIFGRYKVDKIRGKTATNVPRDKWIITENAHDAIVSEEMFNMTKSKKRELRKGVKLGQTLFGGKVVCGCCGRNFYTWSKNHVLLCQTPVLTGNNPGCYDKKLREDDLIALIENAIKCVLQSNKEKTANLRDEANASAKELNLVKKGLQTEVGSLDRIRRNKEKLFQKLMDNQITDDEYMKLSEELELEQITVEDRIRELKKKQKAVLTKKKEKEINVKVYMEIGEIKKIDRNVVEKLVDKMIVSKEGRVEIQWTFKEIFQSA